MYLQNSKSLGSEWWLGGHCVSSCGGAGHQKGGSLRGLHGETLATLYASTAFGLDCNVKLVARRPQSTGKYLKRNEKTYTNILWSKEINNTSTIMSNIRNNEKENNKEMTNRLVLFNTMTQSTGHRNEGVAHLFLGVNTLSEADLYSPKVTWNLKVAKKEPTTEGVNDCEKIPYSWNTRDWYVFPHVNLLHK